MKAERSLEDWTNFAFILRFGFRKKFWNISGKYCENPEKFCHIIAITIHKVLSYYSNNNKKIDCA